MQHLHLRRSYLCAREPSAGYRRIARRIRVTCRAEPFDGGPVTVGLEFKSINGKSREIFVRASEFDSRLRLFASLSDAGYALPRRPADRDLLLEHLHSSSSIRGATIAGRTGWHDSETYVFPSQVVGRLRGKLLVARLGSRNGVPPVMGTLKGWKQGVAQPAGYSTYFVCAVCFSIGSMLLRPRKQEGCVINAVGPSGCGKSSGQRIAASVYGPCRPENIPTWDVTDRGMEEILAENCDGLVILDEIARAADAERDIIKQARRRAFQIVGQVGRVRTKLWGELTTWHANVLSSGEHSIAELARSNGLKLDDGLRVRMVDYPIPTTSDSGVFDALPEGKTSADLIAEISRSLDKHYGVAARAFIKRFLRDPDGYLAKVDAWAKQFLTRIGAPHATYHQRLAKIVPQGVV